MNLNFKTILAIDKMVSLVSAIYRNTQSTRTYVNLANQAATQDERQFYIDLAKEGAHELETALVSVGVDPKKGTIDEKALAEVVEPILPLFAQDNATENAGDNTALIHKLTAIMSKVMAKASGADASQDENELIQEVVKLVSDEMKGDVPIKDVTDFIQRKLSGFKRLEIQRYKGVHRS